MISRNIIHHLDALPLLRGLPDQSIDALITDPPYGMTELENDAVIDWQLFWQEVRRVAKGARTPVILFSQQPFTTDLINSNRAWFRNEIILEKTNATGFLNANRRPLSAHENILIFGQQAPVYHPVRIPAQKRESARVRRERGKADHYDKVPSMDWVDDGRRYPRSVWHFTGSARSESIHPSQKPLACLQRLIELYTDPGWLICDPFIGSGTTALAARSSDRDYIGGDIDAKYVEVARRRLQNSDPYQATVYGNGFRQLSLLQEDHD
jgi:site-specific DNA-methyltransferase (adenine-specific)